jgi:hypothetical protein
MAEFPECLLIVTAEVDASIEAEWNRWYDTVHLPDALRCPGVRRGRRYMASGEITETAAGKTERTMRRIYTTIYELDSPDAIATPEFRAMRGWYEFAPHVRSRTQVIVRSRADRSASSASSFPAARQYVTGRLFSPRRVALSRNSGLSTARRAWANWWRLTLRSRSHCCCGRIT